MVIQSHHFPFSSPFFFCFWNILASSSVLIPFLLCLVTRLCADSPHRLLCNMDQKLLTACVSPLTVTGEHTEDAADGRRGETLALFHHY